MKKPCNPNMLKVKVEAAWILSVFKELFVDSNPTIDDAYEFIARRAGYCSWDDYKQSLDNGESESFSEIEEKSFRSKIRRVSFTDTEVLEHLDSLPRSKRSEFVERVLMYVIANKPVEDFLPGKMR